MMGRMKADSVSGDEVRLTPDAGKVSVVESERQIRIL